MPFYARLLPPSKTICRRGLRYPSLLASGKAAQIPGGHTWPSSTLSQREASKDPPRRASAPGRVPGQPPRDPHGSRPQCSQLTRRKVISRQRQAPSHKPIRFGTHRRSPAANHTSLSATDFETPCRAPSPARQLPRRHPPRPEGASLVLRGLRDSLQGGSAQGHLPLSPPRTCCLPRGSAPPQGSPPPAPSPHAKPPLTASRAQRRAHQAWEESEAERQPGDRSSPLAPTYPACSPRSPISC